MWTYNVLYDVEGSDPRGQSAPGDYALPPPYPPIHTILVFIYELISLLCVFTSAKAQHGQQPSARQ